MLAVAFYLIGWAVSWKLSGSKLSLDNAVYYTWLVSTICAFLAGLSIRRD